MKNLFFVIIILITSASAQAQQAPQSAQAKRFALPALPMPVLTDGNPMWQKGIIRCFQQANVRRTEQGVNTKPLFFAPNGREFGGLPPADANFRCDIPGRHNGSVHMTKK
jgi:hypothetical protein